MGGIKKHKKHKSEKRDKYDMYTDKQPLKLILKVGNSSTPEHNSEWPLPQNPGAPLYSVAGQDEESHQSATSGSYFMGPPNTHHKKSKKKKKKKDKGKDRERKHRHHHKEKKRRREESSQDEVSFGEESLTDAAIGSPGNLSREPRLCVLRQRQERTPLQKLLEHLLKALEKRDPQQFFAWPVTDNIAPGYSHIISKPMDLSTMKQKIDDGLYGTLQEFTLDFKLMCTNAMEYNHMDTVYYKASKKLLHAGMKLMQPDKLGWLLNHIPDLTSDVLGFEIPHEMKTEQPDDDDAEMCDVTLSDRPPLTKFEAIPDDLTPEDILAQCQAAAKEAKSKLSMKKVEPNMGFLRQRKDGSTTLNILIGGDGVIPGSNERPVSLGILTGKLTEGSGMLSGFREDRRNIVKPVKPLYYGAFGSYAPSYDSTFANLSKEESDLVFQTYGSDTAVQYAESILDFAKDCDYTLKLVDNLLDLLTGGDHSKTKKVLEEKKKLKEEEETIRTLLEDKSCDPEKIDLDGLRSLSDLGIDVAFLANMEESLQRTEEHNNFQQRLQTTSQLLEKLQQVQNERLSLPLPPHLSSLPGVSDQEMALAESITTNLTDMAKRVNPSDIVSVAGLRKAMGITLPESDDMDVETLTTGQIHEPAASEMPDLESELRQFLESDPHLSQSPLRDDKTIEEILME